MDDKSIIELLWNRDESAVKAVSEKYERYCIVIAENITGCIEDAEECANEVYQKLWMSIPPNKPPSLKNYIAKITRNTALNMFAVKHSEKRADTRFQVLLDEISECISSLENDTENEFDRKELLKDINLFLKSLPSEKRVIFVSRYWYADSIKDIAVNMKMSENNVYVILQRTRKKLSEYLAERGYCI